MTRSTIPPELQDTGRKLWRALNTLAELAQWEKVTLLEACRTADRLDALQKALKDAPLTVTNSKGDQTANPLLVEARQQAIVYARLLATLRIPEADSGNMPQRRAGVRGVYPKAMAS